jgi:hypothetical protein
LTTPPKNHKIRCAIEIETQFPPLSAAMSNCPLYKSPDDFTAQVLGTLEKLGISTSAEDDFNFCLYLDTKAIAEACAELLQAQGFAATAERSASNEGKPWLCFASQRLTPTRERLAQIGATFMKLADEQEGEFDGWEIQPKPMKLDDGLLKRLMAQLGEKVDEG